MPSYSRAPVLGAAVLVFAIPALATAQRSGGNGHKDHSKIDHALREAIATSSLPQRVIIRATEDTRGAIREALQAHGDTVDGENVTIDALTAEVHAEDVEALADHQGQSRRGQHRLGQQLGRCLLGPSLARV